jgi:hypothetical protein
MKKIKPMIARLILVSSSILLVCADASAYETGVHYYLTYLMGHWCGLGNEADTIALADYSVDLFKSTNAGSHYDEWLNPAKEGTRRRFHFPVRKGSNQFVRRGSNYAWETVNLAVTEGDANQNINPILLGIGIHTLQDSYAHEGFTPTFGHWTQGPDLPESDPEKLVEAAEATWIAIDDWRHKIYGKGCAVAFKEIAPQIESWAELSLHSAAAITNAWEAIAEKIENKKVVPTGIRNSDFKNAFEAAANHVREVKD